MESMPIGLTASDESSNSFIALDTRLSRARVAEVFERAGWACRKASWRDHEVRPGPSS